MVFDADGSYIHHKASGKVTKIYEKNGNFVFKLRVRKGKSSASAVETESEGKSDFGRQASIVQELLEDQY